jgi:ABC-type glycerol-3-phosphate transport system substrate-binding protein
MKRVAFAVLWLMMVVGPLSWGVTQAPGALPAVTAWSATGPEGDALQKAAEQYTRQTGNPVNVVLQARPTYRDKLQIALTGGSHEPDMALIISRDLVPYAAGGFVVPLDGYMAKAPSYNLDDIPKALWPEQQWQGKWYMAPTDLSVETLVYRTDLISSPPKTWDDLLALTKKFTQSITPQSPTKFGYAFSAGPQITEGSWYGILKAYGGAILDDKGKVAVDSPAAIASWTFMVDLLRKYKVTPPDIQSWDYPEILVGFQEGVLAMASFFNAGMPVLADCSKTPKFCGKFALVPQPAGPKGAFTRVQTLGLVLNAASNSRDAAWSFMAWVTGPVGGLAYTQFGGASPRASVAANPQIAKERPWTAAMQAAARSPALAIKNERSKELLDILHKWQSRALAGEISAEDSLKNAAKEMRALLGQ